MRFALSLLSLLSLPILVAAEEGTRYAIDEHAVWFRAGDALEWASAPFEPTEWQTVQLPHRWHRGETGSDFGWYRFTLPGEWLASQEGSLALDLGVVGYVAEVYINGEKIGANGDIETHLGATEYQPDVYLLPDRFLDGRDLEVAIRTTSIWGPGGMLKGPWLIGKPSERLQRSQAFAMARWVVIVALETVILVWVALFLLLLFRQPGSRPVRYGALFFLALAMFYGSFYLHANSLDTDWNPEAITGIRLTGMLGYAGALLFTPLFVRATLRLPVNRRFMIALGGVVGMACLVSLALSLDAVRNASAWGNGLALLRIVALGMVAVDCFNAIRQGKKLKRTGAVALGIGYGALAGLYLLDTVAFILPGPIYLASWLPIGTSRAALIYFGELGVFLLAFCLGQAVMAQHFEREQLIGKLNESLEISRELERDRISRDLHDGVQPGINAIRLQLATLASRETQAAQTLDGMLRSLQGEVRSALHNLRTPWLEGRTLPEALRALTEDLCVEKQVVLEDRLTDELPGPLEAAAFRFLQEAISNVIRHGEASRLIVMIEESSGHYHFSCRDDGRGFDPDRSRTGYGLRTLRERAELFGGSFELQSQPGHGTLVAWVQPKARTGQPVSG